MMERAHNLNPDAMDISEVRAAALASRVFAEYLERKAEAMNYRANGNIRRAMTLEERCDSLFKVLPPSWQW